MSGVKRWSVTYTKHVKQKRKVYQDGFLEHNIKSNKVMLYDESLKLLDRTFLKKDNCVESGQTLSFDGFLVDVGDVEPQSEKGDYLKNKASLGSSSEKVSFDTSSASRKCIEEFKKTALNKYQTSSNSAIKNSSLKGSRFLKKDEVTGSGKATNSKPLPGQEKSGKQQSIPEEGILNRQQVMPKANNIRSAHQILSYLKKPVVDSSPTKSSELESESAEPHLCMSSRRCFKQELI